MSLSLMLSVARSQIGVSEDPPGSNRTPYGVWYGHDGEPWCGKFVSWCAMRSASTSEIPRYAYCPDGAAFFGQRRQWYQSPMVGDIEFLDVAGLGRVSHTGLVTAVEDGRWLAVEGNTDSAGRRDGGSVRERTRDHVGPRGGFGRPLWPAEAPPRIPPPAPAQGRPYPGRPLRQGSRGDAVRYAQVALHRAQAAAMVASIEVDGVFGPLTELAVRWYQRRRGLLVDGVIGPVTWAALAP